MRDVLNTHLFGLEIERLHDAAGKGLDPGSDHGTTVFLVLIRFSVAACRSMTPPGNVFAARKAHITKSAKYLENRLRNVGSSATSRSWSMSSTSAARLPNALVTCTKVWAKSLWVIGLNL